MKGGVKFFSFILVLILIFSISFISASFSDFWNKITGKATVACTDSDGLNYYVKGTTISGTNSFTDYCNQSTAYINLIEGYCGPNGILEVGYFCPNGCSNGACISSTTTTPAPSASTASSTTNAPSASTVSSGSYMGSETTPSASTVPSTNPSITESTQIIEDTSDTIGTGYGESLTIQQLKELQNSNKQRITIQKSIQSSRSIVPAKTASLNTITSQINSTLNSYNLPDTLQTELNDINSKATAWTANYNSIFLKSDEYKTKLLGVKIPELIATALPSNFNAKQDSLINKNFSEKKSELAFGSTTSPINLPASYDLRSLGGRNYITPVKNQQYCGSCWAFATIAAVESTIKKTNPNSNVDLSEQDLLCGASILGGCSGGLPSQALNYIIDSGITDESCLSYDIVFTPGHGVYGSSRGNCGKCSNPPIKKILNFESILSLNNGGTADYVNKMKRALIQNGALILSFAVYDDFYTYSEGIYQHTSNKLVGFHAVAIVGYGSSNGIDYWIAKNSWGTYWGENGFFKIAVNDSSITQLFPFVPLGTGPFAVTLCKTTGQYCSSNTDCCDGNCDVGTCKKAAGTCSGLSQVCSSDDYKQSDCCANLRCVKPALTSVATCKNCVVSGQIPTPLNQNLCCSGSITWITRQDPAFCCWANSWSDWGCGWDVVHCGTITVNDHRACG